MKVKEQQQQLQMQQMHLIQQRNAQMQRSNPNHPPIGGPVNAINTNEMMGKPSPSTHGMKMYEEPMKPTHSMDSETSPALLDASRMALLKSATNHQGYITSPIKSFVELSINIFFWYLYFIQTVSARNFFKHVYKFAADSREASVERGNILTCFIFFFSCRFM